MGASMAKAPAYQEYAADYLADETINLMSLEEEGALARLKQICWVSESIPSDLDKLSRLCKGAPTVVLKAVVEACFKPHPSLPDRLIYPNHEIQKEKQAEWRLKSAEAGKKSAKVRKEKKNNAESTNQPPSLVEPTINQPSTLVEPPFEPNANSSFSSLSLSSSSTSIPKKQKQLPSRDKREADPRHQGFRIALQAYWGHKNLSLEMPWDGRDAKQLSILLSANPTLTEDKFKDLLRNRSKSEVNHSERACVWLARSTDYASGPLNTFNKPVGINNARTQPSAAAQRSNEHMEILRDIYARESHRGAAHNDGCDAPGFSDENNDHVVLEATLSRAS
jgi:uncharacterized protein YdaU (DUF1376 family)